VVDQPRPAENGRRTLVRRRADGTQAPVLPTPWNVRSRVVEYGGLPWAAAVSAGEIVVVFAHFADQRLYAYRPASGGAPRPLTPLSPVGGGLRRPDHRPVPAAAGPGRRRLPARCERFLERPAGRPAPHAYLTFAEEGHGFRQAATTVRALEAELSLYAQVFGLHPPGGVPGLELGPGWSSPCERNSAGEATRPVKRLGP
jgi:hypothetical protein